MKANNFYRTTSKANIPIIKPIAKQIFAKPTLATLTLPDTPTYYSYAAPNRSEFTGLVPFLKRELNKMCRRITKTNKKFTAEKKTKPMDT